MESSHVPISRQLPEDALERLSQAPSLTNKDRACVAYSGVADRCLSELAKGDRVLTFAVSE